MATPRRSDETSVDLTKRPSFPAAVPPGPPSAPPAPPAPAGPAWVVVPARIIALIFVLPFRLLYDLLVWTGRGLKAGLRALGSALLWPFRQLHAYVLRPIGAGIAWLADVLVVRPVRWLAVVVVWGFLRLFGRGSGRLGRWFHRSVIAPIGRFFAWLGRGVGAGLLAVWNGLLWLLDKLIMVPLRLTGRGLWWVLTGTGRVLATIGRAVGTGIAWLVATLIVLPLVLLWRYVLRPPLAGIAWVCREIGSGIAYVARGLWTGLAYVGHGIWAVVAYVGRGIGTGLAYVGRGIGTVLLAAWRAFAGAVAWAWRWAGRITRWLGRVFIVIPALALWNYVLHPIFRGIAEGARMAGRLLRGLWHTLVTAPARWMRDNLFVPAGNVVRAAWRITVRDPLRWMNVSIIAPARQSGRDVRLQLRQAFRRG